MFSLQLSVSWPPVILCGDVRVNQHRLLSSGMRSCLLDHSIIIILRERRAEEPSRTRTNRASTRVVCFKHAFLYAALFPRFAAADRGAHCQAAASPSRNPVQTTSVVCRRSLCNRQRLAPYTRAHVIELRFTGQAI